MEHQDDANAEAQWRDRHGEDVADGNDSLCGDLLRVRTGRVVA